jgi:hypothetical protein
MASWFLLLAATDKPVPWGRRPPSGAGVRRPGESCAPDAARWGPDGGASLRS